MTASNIISLPDLMPESKTEPPHFHQFWKSYPHKVAKLAAQRAWLKAVKVATFQEIMEGVERYKLNKPDHIDFCHPATFLNSGRWMDEPAEPSNPKLSPSMAAMQNTKELDRVELRLTKLRGMQPFDKGQTGLRLTTEWMNLVARRKALLKLLDFSA